MATRERAIPFGIKGPELNFQVVGGLPVYPDGVVPVEETIATGLTASVYNYIEYWLAGWGWLYGSTSAMDLSNCDSVHITGSTVVSMAWSHAYGMKSNSRVDLLLSDNTAIELASGRGELYSSGSTYIYNVDATIDLSGYSAEQLSSVSVRVGLGDISAGGGATSGLRHDANLTIDSVTGTSVSAKPGPPVENPIENTIWVNTDLEIPHWTLDPVIPNYIGTGDVWIQTGTNSSVSFNALKGNWLMIYPISAKQWDGTKLVNREIKIYQNGSWNTAVIYYYLDGDDFSKITGGWNGDVTNSGEVLSFGATLSSGGTKNFYSKKAIDLTNISTLTFVGTVTNAADKVTLTFGVASESPTGSFAASSTVAAGATENEIVVDVSTLTGSYYIRGNATAGSFSTSRTYTADFTEISAMS